MRKFLAALICGALLLSSSLCMASATLEAGKVIVGGIFPGMTVNQLIDGFGQPNG